MPVTSPNLLLTVCGFSHQVKNTVTFLTAGAPSLKAMASSSVNGALRTFVDGAYLTGPRVVGEPARAAMAGVLADVQGGDFVRALMADYDAGFPDLKARRRALAAHPMEAADRLLRAVAARAKG